MASSTQHANPKSDIDIARVAEKRPILEIGKERLGIAPEQPAISSAGRTGADPDT